MNPDGTLDSAPEGRAIPRKTGLGVHVLSEFVFCPRAGLITLPQKKEDDGEEAEDEMPASVSYMPHHDLASLLRDIHDTTRTLKRWIPAPCVSALATVAVGFWLGWCPCVVGVIATACLANPAYLALNRLRDLKELYDRVQSTPAAEPDPNDNSDQSIDWWELQKAGFESSIPPRKFYDDGLNIAGRPRLILHRRGMLIPVFRKRIDGRDPEAIKPKHYVRIAAYCHLLEKASGLESPFGIVLFGYTYRGKALNARKAYPNLLKELEKARRIIGESDGGMSPDPPESAICRGCIHGKPFPTGRSMSIPATATTSRSVALAAGGREYRSVCGELFSWVPPHQKAVDKQLRLYDGGSSTA